MKLIEPNVILEQEIDSCSIMRHIEKAGRVCYKSESTITDNSADRFIKNILDLGHESVIEHVSITFRVVCDRGVSHEIVRHRIASYSQESTRYCNYSKDRFGNELTFIKPCFWETDSEQFFLWKEAMEYIEQNYFALIDKGATPQQARLVLPNSLKTEIFITMNLREWRHFLKLRTNSSAHPQMRQVAIMILEVFKEKLPLLFDDIKIED